MTAVYELRQQVVDTSAPAEFLVLIDDYLQQFEKMGDTFRLPKAHAKVKPFLEMFHKDLSGWVDFARSVRDEMSGRKDERADVQTVFRMLEVRLTQQERRVGLGKAVAKAVEKGVLEDKYAAQVAYADKCTKTWIKRKTILLNSHRTTTKMLTAEFKRELLAEMWAKIDAEIENGEVEKP